MNEPSTEAHIRDRLSALRKMERPEKLEAIQALATNVDPAARAILQMALDTEEDDLTRLSLLLALYALGQYHRLAAILEALKSDDANVRHAVINRIESVLLIDDYVEALVRVRKMIKTETNPSIKADAEAVAQRLFRWLVA